MLLTQEEINQFFPDGMTVEVRLAGGISTLESGFQIAWVQNDCPIECFLLSPKGKAFARFDKDRTARLSDGGLSRAEHEAVQGMKTLVLGWEG